MKKSTSIRLGVGAVSVALLLSACGGGSAPPSQTASTPAPAAAPSNVSTDKNSYPVFPNADTGADPAVPAAQGGKGFTGEGWQTNTAFDLIGDPHAVKGGVFRIAVGESGAERVTVGRKIAPERRFFRA